MVDMRPMVEADAEECEQLWREAWALVDRQDQHVGRDLLERALDYGDRSSPGLIMASPDHRGQRRYLRAGFALHPAAFASGVLDPERMAAVAADSDETARAMVVAGVLETEPAKPVSMEWITAGQQWAFETAADLGLQLQAIGAVMIRGEPGPMAPYLPSGAFA